MKHVTIKTEESRTTFDMEGLFAFFKDFEKKIDTLDNDSKIVLDFSNVIFWDISALLWLVIALSYYKKNGLPPFKLRLPQPSDINIPITKMSDRDIELLRSADYLKRWKFSEALKNITEIATDPLDIIVDEQKEYYSGKPLMFYKASELALGEKGLTEELLSLSLVEIRNLVDFTKQERKIDKAVIDERIDFFIEKAVIPVLVNQCGYDSDLASKFITHLLSEGLENALQHPEATIGMFAISRKDNKLILTITDNGEPIPKTIYPHYYMQKKDSTGNLPEEYTHDKLTGLLKGKIVTHSTMAGVSRKHLSSFKEWEVPYTLRFLKDRPKVGEGLTHIRNSSTQDYNGSLTIYTAGIGVKYTTGADHGDYGSTLTTPGFPWPGNLIRIELDIKKSQGKNIQCANGSC